MIASVEGNDPTPQGPEQETRLMPYELTWEARGVLFTFSGTASDDDLRQSNVDVYAHPKFASIDYEIADFTAVTRLQFSAEALRWTANADFDASQRNPGIRVAIVGTEPVLLGLANMYRALTDVRGNPWKQGQFATVDEARIWLAGDNPRDE